MNIEPSVAKSICQAFMILQPITSTALSAIATRMTYRTQRLTSGNSSAPAGSYHTAKLRKAGKTTQMISFWIRSPKLVTTIKGQA